MSNKYHLRLQTVLAILLILAFILVAILAEVITPTTGQLVDGAQLAGKSLDSQPHPPSPGVLLGTTPGQMDIFYALAHGTRDALIFGLTAALLTALIGLIIGAVGGMSGGWVNQLSMRFTDGVLCFPVIAGVAFFQQIINMNLIVLSGETSIFYYPTYMAGFYKSYLASIRSQANFSSIMLLADPVLLTGTDCFMLGAGCPHDECLDLADQESGVCHRRAGIRCQKLANLYPSHPAQHCCPPDRFDLEGYWPDGRSADHLCVCRFREYVRLGGTAHRVP
jgi:hypothetical protein